MTAEVINHGWQDDFPLTAKFFQQLFTKVDLFSKTKLEADATILNFLVVKENSALQQEPENLLLTPVSNLNKVDLPATPLTF